jgi:hypothetical protein
VQQACRGKPVASRNRIENNWLGWVMGRWSGLQHGLWVSHGLKMWIV